MPVRYQLFILGSSVHNELAIHSIKNLCEVYFAPDYDLEIIDLEENPALAEQYIILATPTLIQWDPSPPRRIMGDLINFERLVLGLGLTGRQPRNTSS